MTLLEVEKLTVSYGAVQAVKDVSLRVDQGEMVALLGSNGAGKTSTLLAIAGIVRPRRGRITFNGHDLTAMGAAQIARSGVVTVPESRDVFTRMTVLENLQLGTWGRKDREEAALDIDRVLERFHVLARRRQEPAGVLSGGEQQILTIARALLARPKLLLLDEPSLGLAPRMVDEIFQIIEEIRAGGTTMLLVEQNALLALRCADRAYVMETGSITISGPAQRLLEDPQLRRAYLGT